ncbi:MAG: hypothetical protein GX484_14690 [Chloroflexi bacterium]|nr:hypothetical protein [Chloroflexota bacterium]
MALAGLRRVAGSVITFLIYTAVASLLPSALAIALLLFLSAGGLIYLLSYLRGRARRVDGLLLEWVSLGRRGEPVDERQDEPAPEETPR